MPPKTFLDRLQPQDRERFDDVSTIVDLASGAYLLRRGDAGGDIYVVESGQLEVVVSQGGPQTVLAVLDPGAMVGEVSFLNHAPQSADVRARTASRVRCFGREDYRELLRRDPASAARFIESLAATTAKRLRRVSSAMSGVASAGSHTMPDTVADAGSEALLSAYAIKDVLYDADVALREDPTHAEALAAVRGALDRLQEDTFSIFSPGPDPELARVATRHLRRELRPWLSRSELAAHCLRELDAATVNTAVVEYVLSNVPQGQDLVGETIDRWLLNRPSMIARRAGDLAMIRRVASWERTETPRTVVLFDTPSRTRVARLIDALASSWARLVVLEPSRAALDQVREQLVPHEHITADLRPISAARIASGRRHEPLPRADGLLLFDVLSYLPDRLAVAFLRTLRPTLAKGGEIVLYGLEEGRDDWLLGQLLRWTTIRRAPSRIVRFAGQAGLEVAAIETVGPGVFLARLTVA